MSDPGHSNVVVDPPFIVRLVKSVQNAHQRLLDQSTPHPAPRWALLVALFLMYGLRVYYLQGFYIVTYGLGIFMLNLLIGFLSPLDDDQLNEQTDGPLLPLNETDQEFKPFMRRLPEFKFWYSCLKAVGLALFLTCFSLFDVPVFWPILLIYFCVLFVLTMKRQIKHMIKHRYLPFNIGKKKYRSTVKKQAEDVRSK